VVLSPVATVVVHPLAELSRWTVAVENVHGPAALVVALVVAVSAAAPPCLLPVHVGAAAVGAPHALVATGTSRRARG